MIKPTLPISNSVVAKTWRAVKGALPMAAVGVIGVAAYNLSPDFREGINWVRSELDLFPRASEMITSGFTMGFLPDFLAQRYVGEKFSYKRSLAMTGLGAVTGGIIAREFYNLQGVLFPEDGIGSLLKKIIVDQLGYTPLYMSFYLTYTNLVQGRPLSKLLEGVWPNLKTLLPRNWVFWGVMALPILYNLPKDLQVYALQFFATMWFSFQSKVAYTPNPEEAPVKKN